MKRILLLLFSLITTAAIGQYPINQILSSDSTMVSVGRNATGGIRGGLVNMVFADTTAANLSRISYYTGAQIWTTTDSAIWVRFKGTPSFWVKMAGASGGTTGSFWNITGNYFGGGVPLNYGVGTNSYDYLPLKTNNITRLLIPPDGILRSSAPANKYLMMDTTTLEMYYGDGGGGTSGWSLTGNAGTDPDYNFIGTTDNKPLVLKTNNLKRIKITADTIFVDSVNTVFENKVPYWSYPNKTYNINRLIYNSNGDRFETKINGQGTSYKHYGNSFVDSSSSPPLSAFVDTWWQNTNGVDTLLWLRGLHHSYNDTHFFLADMTNTIAPNGGIPPNRFMTVEHYGTDFFAWYNIPTYNKPITVAGGLYPASLALGGDLGLSRYGFGVSTRKFFSLDTAYFKKHVGIGTESPDSLLTVKDGGLYANKGVRFSGLPSGIPSGAKRLLISGDGTLYAADTTAGNSVNLVFGGGSGESADTAVFTTSAIYGSFYNDADTIVVTSMRSVLQGTSPDVTYKVWYNDSLNVEAGATALVTAGSQVTNTTTGTNVTSFDVTKIPPGVWVWVKTSTVATKPKYLSIQLNGYRK